MIMEAGRVGVVTGAAQGIGRALAAGLIERGMSVVMADTATDRLQATADEFIGRGGQVLAVPTDVGDAAAVDALAARTIDHFGRVDMIVNNAGIATGDSWPLWQSAPQEWQRVLAVNLFGVVHGIQAFVPHLVTAGAGHIVNVASLAGLTTMPFGGAYCAGKHAVVAISETLHAELEMMGLPIGVTVACPGFVRTPMTEGMFSFMTADDDALTEQLSATQSTEQLRATLGNLLATSIEPEIAAERILAAVDAGRLYALTHGDFDGTVRRRTEGILSALDDQR